jgi:hypothetical protein
MALIRFPEGQQRSGSAGGTVYSHNRYGAYVRARSIPVNPQTARQTAIRTALKNLTTRWLSTLTQTQRDSWDLYASNLGWVNKFGDAINLTGQAHYLRSNSVRIQAGLGIVDDGPTVFTLPEAPYVFNVSASEAAQQVFVAFDNTEGWANEDDAALLLFQGKPRGAARNFFNGPWRYIGKVDGDSGTPPTSPTTPDTAWPFVEDHRMTVYGRVTRADGRLSEKVSDDFFCAA